MKDAFPHKQKGDALTADHVNSLSGVCRKVASEWAGGGLSAFRGSFHASASDQAHIEFLVKVLGDASDEISDDPSGVYTCVQAYYDHSEEAWAFGEDEYELDVRGFNQGSTTVTSWPVLIYGDLLTARYDEQRGTLVPVNIPFYDIVIWVPNGGIPARSGRTISSVMCEVFKEINNGATKTLEELEDADDEVVQVRVFNHSTAAVEECTFAIASLTRDWTRYVVLEPCEPDGCPESSSSVSDESSSTSSASSVSESSSSESDESSSSSSSSISGSSSSTSSTSSSSTSSSSISGSSSSTSSTSSDSSLSSSSSSATSTGSSSTSSSSTASSTGSSSSSSSTSTGGSSYQVTGDPNPDCTTASTGASTGVLNGKPKWEWNNSFGGWILYWSGAEWIIENAAYTWVNSTLLGNYTATGGGATGTATVSEV